MGQLAPVSEHLRSVAVQVKEETEIGGDDRNNPVVLSFLFYISKKRVPLHSEKS